LKLVERAIRRFFDIEGSIQATVLAAQAFTSLIPFMVVVAAFSPGNGDLADRIVNRFDLSGAAERSVEQLFASSGETQSAVTWISIVILLLSALSFTRALQRIFQRAYAYDKGGVKDISRGFGWIVALGAWVTVSSPLKGALEDVGGLAFAVTLSSATGFVLWLGTPMLLLGEHDWRHLAPGALSSAILGALLGVASGIYVPIAMTWSADRYGLIGIAFALQSWLLVAAFVVVIGAVVGATVVERADSARSARTAP
jgi:membrane protein